jgi:hypothetical protein
VVFPLPAGLGAREAILIVTIGELLGRPAATTLALTSRLVQVAVDLLLATASGVPHALSAVRQARQGPVDREVS